MTDLVQTGILTLENGERCFSIGLDAPRANALEPGLMAALSAVLDELDASGARTALLTGGRNFSSGGDVGRFYEAALSGQAVAYAEKVVPPLQQFVLRMIGMPVIFAVAARGAVTGGSAGFLFASDLAVLSPDAFVQPYYGVAGFAPDGGWTATLPERIGAGPALQWILSNRRAGAEDLVAQNLADCIHDRPEEEALRRLSGLDINTALAAKALILDEDRRALIEKRLNAETVHFRDLIGRAETVTKMGGFPGLEVNRV